MPKELEVKLIDWTGKGDPNQHAAMDKLLFTKNTRLKMDGIGLEEIGAWSMDKKLAELDYMANTIPSSWEFVTYTFTVQNCSRAFTHQLVRTRIASFAERTLAFVDVSESADYYMGPGIDTVAQKEVYEKSIGSSFDAYKKLLESGVHPEDARGVLPLHIHTAITGQMNLRILVDLIKKRESPRNVGEQLTFTRKLREVILTIHPWAEVFLSMSADKTANKLYALIQEEFKSDRKTMLAACKLVDQLRGS